jgi:hypothetical protein
MREKVQVRREDERVGEGIINVVVVVVVVEK